MTAKPLLFHKELHDRIMKTMTKNINKILAATAEEIVEVSQVCTKGIRIGINDALRVHGSEQYYRWRTHLIQEMAQAMVMLTALNETFEVDYSELEEAAKEVCARYDGKTET